MERSLKVELFFDTETSDKIDFKSNITYKSENFPWIVQLGAVLAEDGIAYAELNVIIKSDGRTIAAEAERVHNISIEKADLYGISEKAVAKIFIDLCSNAKTLIAHNMNFDSLMIAGLLYRCQDITCSEKLMLNKPKYCTMLNTTDLCKLKNPYGYRGYKWPKLQELHVHLFGEEFKGAHDAMFDIKATMKCYYKLKENGWIK